MNIIAGLIGLLTSFFKGEGTSKAAGTSAGLLFYGGIVAAGYWLFSDGGAKARAYQNCLNAYELIGYAAVAGMVVAILFEWARRLPPPGP